MQMRYATLQLAALSVLLASAHVAAAPFSTQPPYLVAAVPGVEFTALLSAGDAVPLEGDASQPYRMAGTPDGLGAYDNGDGTFTLLMNHEFSASRGAVRAHGGRAAFISQWRIRKADLAVLSGQDLIRRVMRWDAAAQKHVEQTQETFRYFCSADLPAASAFYNRKTGLGWNGGRIFLNGEETRDGRAYAHLDNGREHGTSYELPLMGRHAHENVVPSPFEQDKTIVIGTEDGGQNKVYVYTGEKQKTGNPVERAGLMNGQLFQIHIDDYINDDPVQGFKAGRFSLGSEGGTSLSRPEDGAWDTQNPNRFYFATTSKFNGNTRLWQLEFDNIRKPELGGAVSVLVEGAHVGMHMLDNLTVDGDGDIYLQEDVGNHPHLGAIWRYRPKTASLEHLASFDPERFNKGAPRFLTEDEESSGIIEVTELFRGVKGVDFKHYRYLLLTVQAHHPMPDEIVSGGQLLLMKVPR